MTLGEKIKYLRKKSDMSQQTLADYLEIKTSSFYNWLKGQYDFSTERQNRLAEIIGNLKE